MMNLSGADCRGVNFGSADLSKADCRGANFGNADLSKADFSGANLSGALLCGADLRGADLSGAFLRDANLREADLRGANLHGADLRGVRFRKANLQGADLCEAWFRGALLREADLSGALLLGANLSEGDLRGAVLCKANLSGANLIDACLDRANLTGARLWETQRSGWSIKAVICQRASWDRKGKELIEYGKSEFERIFTEKPCIVMRYPGGMSLIDILALPLVVEQLQLEHPGSVLQIRSMQNDAGGASVTITVEDSMGRSSEALKQELACMQTKLEFLLEDRAFLRSLVSTKTSTLSDLSDRVAKQLASPTQNVHLYCPTGQVTIEGPTMSQDTYNIPGQAGAVGPGAHARDNTFQQIQSGIDLPKLAEELGRLRTAMKGEATGTSEQDKAISAVVDAEDAATKGNGPAALRYLKDAGTWALGIAEKIGVSVVIEVLNKAI